MKNMKIEKKMLLLTVAILVLNGCNLSEKKDTNTVPDEAAEAIAASNAVYFEAFVKNDPSIFIDRYAEDACILAPFAPQACGRDAIAKFFSEAYDTNGLRNGKFTTTALYGNGNEYVVEEGLWQSYNARGELFDNGKFLVLWKKTGNGWKMFRDAFSSNRTAANSISDTWFLWQLAFYLHTSTIGKHQNQPVDFLTCKCTSATGRFVY